MHKKTLALYSGCALILFLHSCSVRWTDAMGYGKIDQADFIEKVNMEVRNGLIFVPVKIKGKYYRFLFDSGAPFSISEELQKTYQFNIISKGHIVDADRNRMKVDFVQVDTIRIGNIPFIDQTAFVGNFRSNPILECLEIDGIIGSNLIRNCNWTIDQEKSHLTLSNSVDEHILEKSVCVPFRTDVQYNIFLDIGIGKSIVRGMQADYGFNGPITVPGDVFSVLKQNNVINETFVEKGYRQSGIIGKPVEINREITFADSVKIDNQVLNDTELRTGSSALIGNKVLSQFVVTIDWNGKCLHLQKNSHDPDPDLNSTYGFSLGFSSGKRFFVQSVLETSSVYNQGIRPGTDVVKMDSLDFSQNNDFCDYLILMENPPEALLLEIIDPDGIKRKIQVERTRPWTNDW